MLGMLSRLEEVYSYSGCFGPRHNRHRLSICRPLHDHSVDDILRKAQVYLFSPFGILL